ncbi:hypothetical protein LOK49_LG13G00831 [Camellia lanceoleosa]|uniref:Uncharacterized protein n=1 Tax=Camellia lanceoleosa TaxID=1840588 RepID=A0ACC0FL92_9ERIC|nr:hypothetical protein LOK49_LG13G00831 [Camellia lanceoleosa]
MEGSQSDPGGEIGLKELILSRFGCKNKPFYRVMAADSRSSRDGKHLEVLGYYNPLPGQDGGKRMGLNFDRRVEAHVIDTGDIGRGRREKEKERDRGCYPANRQAMGRKSGPRDTRPIDPMTGRYLTADKPANGEKPKDSEGNGDGDDEATRTTP